MWWSLPSLYLNLLGDDQRMSLSKWYQSWWPWWLKSLTKHGLHALRLRKAVPISDDEEADMKEYRVSSKVTMRTYALMLLWPRWSQASARCGKRKKGDVSDAWRSGLQRFVRRFFGETEFSVTVFLDKDCCLSPLVCLPLYGRRPVGEASH